MLSPVEAVNTAFNPALNLIRSIVFLIFGGAFCYLGLKFDYTKMALAFVALFMTYLVMSRIPVNGANDAVNQAIGLLAVSLVVGYLLKSAFLFVTDQI